MGFQMSEFEFQTFLFVFLIPPPYPRPIKCRVTLETRNCMILRVYCTFAVDLLLDCILLQLLVVINNKIQNSEYISLRYCYGQS